MLCKLPLLKGQTNPYKCFIHWAGNWTQRYRFPPEGPGDDLKDCSELHSTRLESIFNLLMSWSFFRKYNETKFSINPITIREIDFDQLEIFLHHLQWGLLQYDGTGYGVATKMIRTSEYEGHREWIVPVTTRISNICWFIQTWNPGKPDSYSTQGP